MAGRVWGTLSLLSLNKEVELLAWICHNHSTKTRQHTLILPPSPFDDIRVYLFSYREWRPPKPCSSALYLRYAKCSVCHISGIGTPQKWGTYPWILNSAKIFAQCTYLHCFIILHLIIHELSCCQTYKQPNKQKKKQIWLKTFILVVKHGYCNINPDCWKVFCHTCQLRF